MPKLPKIEVFRLLYKKFCHKIKKIKTKTKGQRIIMDALKALKTMIEPGTIQELLYQWKQPDPEIT